MTPKPKTTRTGKAGKQADDRISYLASLADNLPDALISTDLEFNLLEWNAAAKSMYGWQSAEVLGHPVGEFIHTEYLDTTGEGALKALLEEGVWRGEVAQTRKDGSRFPVMSSVSVVRDRTGKPIGFVAINRDITERKQAEEQLQQSEERFSTAFHSTPTALILARVSDRRIEDVNESFLELVGYQREEVIGQIPAEISPFPNPEQIEKIRKLLSDTKHIRNFEADLRTKSGEIKTVLYSVDIIQLNHTPYTLSTMIDITPRIQAEKKVVQMKRLYATLSQINQTIVRVKNREDLYQSICDVARKFGEFTLTWIGLLDEASGDVQPVAASGMDVTHWPLPIINIYGGPYQNGVIAEALRTSLVVTSEDVQTDKRTKSLRGATGKYGFRSLAVVPFRLQGKTIGVLNLISPEPGSFKSSDEILLLEEMGLDISFALDTMEIEAERKRAVEKVQRQNQRLKVLHEIDTAILASDSVENIVGAALDHIRELIDCERANLALIDWEKNEAVNFDVRDTKESAISKGARVSLDLIQDILHVLSQNQPVLMKDLTLLPDPPPQVKIFIKEGLRSRCILPLLAQGKLIGSFTLSSKISDYFDEEKVNLGREVANQVAIALTQNHLIEELRESEEKYHAFFQNSMDAILLASPDGNIRAANPAACKMFGRTEAEICAVGRSGLVDTNDPRLAALLEERAKTGKAFGELTMLRHDGTPFPVEMSSALFQDRQGNARTSMIIRDITERKQAERDLHESEQKFSILFKRAPFAASLARLPDGAIVEVNEEFEKLIGYPREEVIGKTSLDLNLYPDPETRARMAAEFQARGFTRNAELGFRTKLGELRHLLINTDFIEVGREKHVLTTAQDVTERKQAEEKIRLKNLRLKVLRDIDTAILSAESMESIVHAALSHVHELLSCHRASLSLIDWGTNEADTFDLRTTGETSVPTRTRTPLALFQAMIQTLSMDQPIVMQDLSTLADPPPLIQSQIRDGSRSMCLLPLFSQNNLIGSFSLFSEIPGFFDVEKIELGREIANQVAIASTQKRLIATLHESEQKFSTLFEKAAFAIALSSLPDGVIINVNESFEEIFGFTRQESIGRTSLELGLNPDAEGRARVLAELKEHGFVRNLELSLRVKSGELRLFAVNLDFVNIGDQKYILNVTQDITERRRAEQAMIWLASFPERNPNPVVEIDLTGAVFYMNPAAQHRFPELSTQGFDHPWLKGIESMIARLQQEEIGELQREVQIGDRWYSQPINYVRDAARVRVYGADITERKQADDELRYQAYLLENVNDAIVASDAQFRIKAWNLAAEEMYGWKAEEVLGRSGVEILQTMFSEADAENMRRQIAESGYYFGEATQLRKDGTRIPVEVASMVLRDDTGRITDYVSVNRDITERQRAQAALRVGVERFQRFVESNIVGIVIANASGTILTANDYYLNILGVTRKDIEDGAVDWRKFTPPEWLAADEKALRELQERGICEPYEKEYELADGTRVPVYIANAMLPGPEEQIAAFVLDTTDLKQAEEKIRHQLERLNSLRTIDTAITSSFDLPVTLDVVLQQVLSQLGVNAAAILLVNPEMQTIEYAASRGFHSDILHHTRLKLGEGYAGRSVRERKTIHISDLMETGGSLASSLLLEHESFVDYYSTPLNVKGEVKGVLEIYHRSNLTADADWLEYLETLAGQAAIAIDNAQLFENLQRSNTELERRVLERTAALNKANAELEHANRAKDEFLANMSHELRTPLNSILGMSESLLEQRRGSLNEHQQKSLQIVETSGKHLLELITDILDLSKIEAGKLDFYPEPVSVDELCRASLAFVKAQAVKKSITVTYTNQSAVTEISADIRRLKQILVNLLTNAVKFTPENGNITLQVNTELEQDLIRFSVIDTGIGISEKDMQRLFQPFVQVDSSLNRKHEGTGLGLALVQKLTDLHGGSVQVESEVGRGSRFSIDLPCRLDFPAKSARSEIAPDKKITDPGNPTTVPTEVQAERGVILLAEDNMPNILTIGEYVESYGYRVVVAHDGLEALAKAEEVGPDLILMDIQMPAMNGLEAIAHLRANSRFAATPIIALTALAMPGDRERCLEAGANEYMSKPVSLKAMIKRIQQLLGSED